MIPRGPLSGTLWRAGVALGLAAVLGWPALATVGAARRGGPEAGGGLLSPIDPSTGGLQRPLALAVETLRLVGATELLALPAGIVLGLILFRTDAPFRRAGIAVLAVSAFVPMPLHATAWLGAFGNAGRAQALGLGMLPVFVSWPGAAFVHAMAALPWVALIVGLGTRAVEPELEDAARLDLSGVAVAARVTLRRSLGAILAAALAVAVLTAGDMTVTDLLRVRTYAEEAYLQYNLGNGPAAAAAVSLPPLLVLGLLTTAGARTVLNAEPARLPTAGRPARTWHLGVWRWPVGGVATAVVYLIAALPLATLVWRAGRVGGDAAAGVAPRWTAAGLAGTLQYAWDDAAEPLGISLVWAFVSATAAVALAWSLAWFSRAPSPWRPVTSIAIALALATPGPVLGFALVYAYRPWPDLYDSAGMLVLAAVARTFPYALLVLWPAVRGIPADYLDMTALDGLGPIEVAARVGLPLTRSSTLAAWGVAFTLTIGELPATNLVTPPGTTPLSVVVWGLMHTGVESHLAGVVLVLLAVVAAAGGVSLAVYQWQRPA